MRRCIYVWFRSFTGVCLHENPSNCGETQTRLLSNRTIRAPLFPKAENQFLFGGVGFWATTQFSTCCPSVLDALQSAFLTHRAFAFSDARDETDDYRSELSQTFGGNETIKGPDVYAPFLEVVKAIDDRPLVPPQTVQFRHHQFIALHQGVECCLELGSLAFLRAGADDLAEYSRTTFRFQQGDLCLYGLVGGAYSGISNWAGSHLFLKLVFPLFYQQNTLLGTVWPSFPLVFWLFSYVPVSVRFW